MTDTENLPPHVQHFLSKPGNRYHGQFKVVGDGEEAARFIAAKRGLPQDRMVSVFSSGAEYSPERIDYLCSEPKTKSQEAARRDVASADYETPEERSAA